MVPMLVFLLTVRATFGLLLTAHDFALFPYKEGLSIIWVVFAYGEKM